MQSVMKLIMQLVTKIYFALIVSESFYIGFLHSTFM